MIARTMVMTVTAASKRTRKGRLMDQLMAATSPPPPFKEAMQQGPGLFAKTPAYSAVPRALEGDETKFSQDSLWLVSAGLLSVDRMSGKEPGAVE
jgi:hypothetical protein